MRALGQRIPEAKVAILDSIEPTKALLYGFFSKLKLKDKSFSTFQPATDGEIEALWSTIHLIDQSLTPQDKTKKSIHAKKAFLDFLQTHCKSRQYLFSILKCGNCDCHFCKTPRLVREKFTELCHLPDPIPQQDHYQSFGELYGKDECTPEDKFCPSLNAAETKSHKMPFPPSAQYANNVGIVLIARNGGCCTVKGQLGKNKRNDLLG